MAWFASAAGSALLYCAPHSDESDPLPMAPNGGVSAATGGAATASGGAALASGGARPTVGGTPSTSPPTGGTAATPSTGGASSAGAPGGGAATGGATAGGTATGGSSGGSPASGGTGGAANDAGAANDDRCSIAKLDPARPPQALSLSGNLGTHDPTLIAAHGQYYLFSTGDQLGAKTSKDLRSWQAAPEVFTAATRPSWLAERVPGVMNLWAPDISFFGGKYHLYYSASTFGCNVSCIGHLTRPALDSGTWSDEGAVVCSNEDRSCDSGSRPDDWNAIDPNLIVDQSGKAWLAFGSFWGGIQMIELDENGARAGTEVKTIAARPSNGGALEAPFIVRRCGYYYLFTSWDACCKGADSTYNLRVGRSASVTGPYVDRDGKQLLTGGGTLVLTGGTRYRGPGHNAVLFTADAAYNAYHAYDADNRGDPVLRISELAWDDDGWPVSGGP
jgi:arabinan endo-1,5-alpha-L-arabinosidase